MNITICHQCNMQQIVPSHYLGREVKCSRCSHFFTANLFTPTPESQPSIPVTDVIKARVGLGGMPTGIFVAAGIILLGILALNTVFHGTHRGRKVASRSTEVTLPSAEVVPQRVYQSVNEPTRESCLSIGTLHKSTLGEWKRATHDNKLATALDWIRATRWNKCKRNMDKAKIEAAALFLAVEKAADAGNLDSMSAAEYAAAILVEWDRLDSEAGR